MCTGFEIAALGTVAAASATSAGVAARNAHQTSKAQKTAASRQAAAQKRAASAQANAEAAKPGQSHTVDLGTSMTAAKKARGVQSTFLASRQPTQSTLGVA